MLWVPNDPLTNWPEASVMSSPIPFGLEKLTPPVWVEALKKALSDPSLLVGSAAAR